MAEPWLALQRRVGNQAVVALVRRSVTWKDGKRTPVLNQAMPLTDYSKPYDYGTTFGIINNETFPARGEARNGVAGPDLTISEPGDGTATVRVTKEPVNVASYLMEIPTQPPWKAGTFKKDYIRGLLRYQGTWDESSLELLDSFDEDETERPLEAEGNPNDATFAKGVEVHEETHVNHLKDATDTILKPWDTMVSGYLKQPFHAQSKSTAAAEFYRHVGGRPEEIGSRIGQHFKDAGYTFHGTPGGKPPTIDRLQERGLFWKTVYFRLKHPD